SWTGPESPVTAAELAERSVADIIDYVRQWRPDEDAGQGFGRSVEGLGGAIGQVVAGRAAEFADLAPDLVDLDPTYVREFFSGLETALSAGATFSWTGPLALAA